MGSPLGGRVCVPVHALDRIVGLPEPLTPSSFAMRSPWWVELAYFCSCSIVTKALTWICSWVQVPSRWDHPVRVECPYLCMYSIGTKVFTWFCLAMCSFAMGSPFYDRVAIPMYVLDRNERFHLVFSGFVFLRDGVTLSGSRVHTCVCTRSKRRVSVGFVWHCVPSRWYHPFRVACS